MQKLSQNSPSITFLILKTSSAWKCTNPTISVTNINVCLTFPFHRNIFNFFIDLSGMEHGHWLTHFPILFSRPGKPPVKVLKKSKLSEICANPISHLQQKEEAKEMLLVQIYISKALFSACCYQKPPPTPPQPPTPPRQDLHKKTFSTFRLEQLHSSVLLLSSVTGTR